MKSSNLSQLSTHLNTWKKSLSIPWSLTRKYRCSRRHSLKKLGRPPLRASTTSLRPMKIQATSFCAKENTERRGTWHWLKRRYHEGPQGFRKTKQNRPRQPRTLRSRIGARFLKTRLMSTRYLKGPQWSSCMHIPLQASIFNLSRSRSQPRKKRSPSFIKGKFSAIRILRSVTKPCVFT